MAIRIYHGGCVECYSQETYGFRRCRGCRYKKAIWSLPNLFVEKETNIPIWPVPDNLGLNEDVENIKTITELITLLPQQPQVQYDLTQQLSELRTLANKFGLYDAADILRERFGV